jgi:hypothetical protein
VQPRDCDIENSAAIAVADEDRSTWHIHVKDVPRMSIPALLQLSSSSSSVRAAFVHASGWLTDLSRYQVVPRRSANGAPRARLSDEWVAALVQYGVCTPIPRAAVRGHVRMFGVPEPAKKRFRPIKHTADVNEVLGKDTLLPLRFPSKAEIINLVNKGSHFIALDFSAYFDQFLYAPEVGELFCFRHGSKFFRLCTLAMGQRQAVEVAATATALLLDFDRRTQVESVIDNVIFVGSREDVLRDAAIFVDRVRAAGGRLNEDVANLESLVSTSGEWCGVAIDLTNKTASLTTKSVAKVVKSWGMRASWTWRGFAAHIGLLFWAWGILDLPMPEFFPVLSFVSRVGRNLSQQKRKT